MKTLAKFFVLAAVAVVVPAAQAHFLWVDVDTSDANQAEARFYFSEAAYPGSAELVNRMDPTVAWVLTKNNEPLDLTLSTWTDEEEGIGALVAPISASDSCSVEGNCCYGVFARGNTSMLLNYYAKHLHLVSPGDLEGLASTEKLALDIRPSMTDGKLLLTVVYQDEPVSKATVVVIDPKGEEHELETDSQGQVAVPNAAAGRYEIRSTFIQGDASGEYEGETYAQTWHIATLTMMLTAAGDVAGEEVSATDLLTQARASRAVWEGFPGMKANLTIEVDDQVASGTITIDESGTSTLEGFGDLANDFVQQQLDSMIMHRMDGSTVVDEGADYEPETGTHVLGKKVRLVDERMGSIYRIKDGVITEVNRNMGPLHFTISVMDVDRNKEGNYLPSVFTVSFWNKDSGEVHSTHTYTHSWKRVGPYDLPETLTIVSAEKGTRRVVRMNFSDQELLKDEG